MNRFLFLVLWITCTAVLLAAVFHPTHLSDPPAADNTPPANSVLLLQVAVLEEISAQLGSIDKSLRVLRASDAQPEPIIPPLQPNPTQPEADERSLLVPAGKETFDDPGTI